jgi:hypothetical protein
VGSSTPTTRTPNIVLTLSQDEQRTVEVEVALPDPEAGELGADVMVLFDRSGSFSDDLDTFRTEAGRIVDALTLRFPDLRIGLASFVDAPCLFFGSPGIGDGSSGDFGYELDLSLPDSAAGGVATAFREALEALDIRSGGDGPKSQLEAIRQALTGDGWVVDPNVSPDCSPIADIPTTSPGFRIDRVRFLIVSTDASFHRPDPEDAGYPYPTGVQEAIDVALETGTTVFFRDSGFTDAAADDIAAATGGRLRARLRQLGGRRGHRRRDRLLAQRGRAPARALHGRAGFRGRHRAPRPDRRPAGRPQGLLRRDLRGGRRRRGRRHDLRLRPGDQRRRRRARAAARERDHSGHGTLSA